MLKARVKKELTRYFLQVTWLFGEDECINFPGEGEKELTHDVAGLGRDESEEADASFDVTSILDDDDDDELEFDIVNIATDLLKLPKYLSYDALGKGYDAHRVFE